MELRARLESDSKFIIEKNRLENEREECVYGKGQGERLCLILHAGWSRSSELDRVAQ
jgi:hypothetical protein